MSSNGMLSITNDSLRLLGHAFYPSPLQFKKNNANNLSTVVTFSTNFVLSIISKYPDLGGHGLAFILTSTKEPKDCRANQYLGLPNVTGKTESSSWILAVEFDIVQNPDFQDINDNHVRIDISSLISNISEPAAYYNSTRKEDYYNNSIILQSGNPIQVWVDYKS